MSDTPQNGNHVAVRENRALAKPKLEADGAGVMAIIPRDLPEAVRYANGLAQSGIVPDSFRYDGKKDNEVNVNLVTMGVLKSMEIGLPPQTGLAFLLPINGRFSVWGDGMWALAQREGQIARHTVEWIGDDFDKDKTELAKWPNDYGCIVSIWRKGQADPYVGKFTVGDARRANLWANNYKKPWVLYPDRMLFNRARAFPLRDGFADALFGLGIAEEELDKAPPPAPRQRIVDNSALDDDLPVSPPGRPAFDDIEARADAYKAGLAMISTLESLAEYQTADSHVELMQVLQRKDEAAYNALISANARRYQEIEAAEVAREEAAADAKDAADEQEKDASGDAPGELFDGDA
jgi:hypothetical protein